MASFDIKAVEPLDYDFTGFDKNTGNGKCKGRGNIPEPTQKHLNAFSAGMKNLAGKSEEEDISSEDAVAMVDKTIEESGATDATEANAIIEKKVIGLIAGLCQNSPSAAQLTELPPRIRTAFMKWVHKQLADPKVTSGDTRQ